MLLEMLEKILELLEKCSRIRESFWRIFYFSFSSSFCFFFFKLFIYFICLEKPSWLEFAWNAYTIRTMAYYCYSNDFYCKQYFLLKCFCFVETCCLSGFGLEWAKNKYLKVCLLLKRSLCNIYFIFCSWIMVEQSNKIYNM